ncbi:MAG: hypothetical protein JXP36_13935 [Bacteroidales bacterium]|nr:hypothetical protein [Bacteroidales bacterium]
MKFLILIIPFLLLIQSVNNDPGKNILMKWDQNEKLEWNDFMGVPSDTIYVTNSHFVACAVSCIELKYRYSISNNEVDFVINNYFNRQKSFTCDTLSQQLLEHEQCHFDLHEVYARKIRRQVKILKNDGVIKIAKYIEIYKDLNIELDSINNLFDSETFYGNKETKQKEWYMRIKNQLVELSEYSYPAIED